MDTTAANQYFQNRIRSEAWESATEAQKQRSLATAEIDLEPLKARVNSTRYWYAVYEQALFLLEDSPRAKLQAEGVVSASMGFASETFQTGARPAYIAPRAWSYIQDGGMRIGGLR